MLLSSVETLELESLKFHIKGLLRCPYQVESDIMLKPIIDPEYPEWEQIGVIVKTNCRFDEKIKSEIYKLAHNDLSDKLFEKTLIKIEWDWK